MLLVEADPGGAPLPRDGVAVAGVVVGLDELLVEVAEVGDEVLPQRLDQAEAAVGGDEVVGRHDDVVLGGGGAHLGQQVLVGGEDVVVDPDVGVRLVGGDGLVVDVVGPVGPVQLARGLPVAVDLLELVLELRSGGSRRLVPAAAPHAAGGQERPHAEGSRTGARVPQQIAARDPALGHAPEQGGVDVQAIRSVGHASSSSCSVGSDDGRTTNVCSGRHTRRARSPGRGASSVPMFCS